MHDAVAQKLRLAQGGDHAEHPPLFGEFEVGLEADQIIGGGGGVFFAQLQYRVRALAVVIVQSHGLEHAEAQRIFAAGRHDLDGHTALEHLPLVKIVHQRPLRARQRLYERLIRLLIHGGS